MNVPFPGLSSMSPPAASHLHIYPHEGAFVVAMSGHADVEPGDKLVGVNGMAISAKALYEALQAPINTTTILPLVVDDDKTVWSGEVDKGYTNPAVAKAAEEGTLRKLRGFVRIQIMDTSAAETALHFEPASQERKAKVLQENKKAEAVAKQEAARKLQVQKQEAMQKKVAAEREEKQQMAKASAEQSKVAAAAAKRAAEAKAAKAKVKTNSANGDEAKKGAAAGAAAASEKAKAAALVAKGKAAAIAAAKGKGGTDAAKAAKAKAAAAAVAAAKKKAAAAAAKKAAQVVASGESAGGGGGGGGGGGDASIPSTSADPATAESAVEKAKVIAEAAKKKAAESAKQRTEDAKKKARETAIRAQKAKEEAKKKERGAAVAAEKELIKNQEAEKRKKIAGEVAKSKAVLAENARKRSAGEEYTFKVVFAEPGTMGLQFSTTARFAELNHIEPGSAATRVKETLQPTDVLVSVNQIDTTGMDARQAMQAIGQSEWPRRLEFRWVNGSKCS
jgi:hypothetical protein